VAVLPEITNRVEVPHEPGEWFEFRDLSPIEQMECRRDAWQRVALGFVADETEKEAQVAFETSVLMLERGVAGWSYDVPCTPENVRRLDIATMTWALSHLAGAEEESAPKAD